MSHPPELLESLREACARLGKDAAEVRGLLAAGDVALALEVLIDQYDALGATLPPKLVRFGLVAQLRSDLEDLLELLAAQGEHGFDSPLSSLLSDLASALGGDRAAERTAVALAQELCARGALVALCHEDEDHARRRAKTAVLNRLEQSLRTLNAMHGGAKEP